MKVGHACSIGADFGKDPRMVVLHTDHLCLREFTMADAPALNAIESIPEVARKIGFEPSTLAEAESMLTHMMAWMHDEPRQHIGLAITVEGDNEYVGRSGLVRTGHEPGEAELWYSLHPDYWGRGLMTEAARAIIGYGFEELDLHRIWADVDPGNVGSWRVMEKIGMRREGHLLENAWIGGEWQDSYLYAMLKREWP